MNGICIWAHSICPSTSALYREVVRQAGVPVRVAVWKDVLKKRVQQGIGQGETGGVQYESVGDDWNVARRILDDTDGWVHVVCAYQVWKIGQHVMRISHERGDRVVVYSEAPCEMCVGVKAWVKRMYYRLVLPWKMKDVVKCADKILSQSGTMGADRLMRLGWRREQIVPFGYACDGLAIGTVTTDETSYADKLRVLHLGVEAKYRGVKVLEKVRRMNEGGRNFEIRCTGGKMPIEEVAKMIEWADVVLGCGLCEPWGMRINDAVMAWKPVIVSDGMGASWMVEQSGCGLVVPRGDAKALTKALTRCAEDRACLARLKTSARHAAENWSPNERAKEFLKLVIGREIK